MLWKKVTTTRRESHHTGSVPRVSVQGLSMAGDRQKRYSSFVLTDHGKKVYPKWHMIKWGEMRVLDAKVVVHLHHRV